MLRQFPGTLHILIPLVAFVQTTTWGDTITHFQAVLTSDQVIEQGVMPSQSLATGIGTFTLTQPDGNPGGTTLQYFVQFSGVDLDGSQTPSLLDDVIGVHFHDVRECIPNLPCQPGDTANTHHLLNVYGLPASHDNDLIVDPVASTIQGLWDDGDATMGSFHSHPISDDETLDALFGGHVFLMVHTNEYPGGAFGGFLTMVPEPTMFGFGLAFLSAIAFLRRRPW